MKIDKKKIMIFVLFLLIMPSLIHAQQTNLGTFESGSCIELIQLCGDCTYNNITSIQYPNETKIILDVIMTRRGTEYNYTYCFPEANGQYNINGFGDLGGESTVWAYTLLLTPNGEDPTTPKLLLHYGGIFILILFLLASIIGMTKLKDPKGIFALYWISHLLFVAVTFMLWNGSLNLLTSAPFVIGFFRILFWVGTISILPMILLSVAWMIIITATSKEITRLIDKGFDPVDAEKRVGRKKR